ncbi:MAG: hypothetical protein WC730_03840 [Patescibacteria group bacterium]|jgi:hypothetical protein
MDKTLTIGKRVASALLAGATILWAVGIAAFAVPQAAQAASAGDLIKGSSLSTVYYYGYDGSRYTFPNLKTYETWYFDFSGVSSISDSALAAIPLAGNVVYRPGSYWVKIQSDPKTYAVSTDGTIHWIESETVATNFAGSNWNTQIHDVPDTFFVDYTVGTSLMDADAYDGMMWKDGSNYYVDVDGAKRLVSSAGRTANNMRDVYFLDGTGIDASALSSGTEITSEICDLTDAAQTGCTTVSEGDLTVSLSSSTPAGATLPKSATAVEIAKFNVTAGSDASTLSQLTLTMAGVGSTVNLANVYLYDGTTRLTEARSVNASSREVTFGSLDYEVAANSTETLSVVGEVAATGTAVAADQFAMQIKESADVVLSGDGSVSGSFPLTANTFQIANVSSGTVTIVDNGTISNPSVGANDAKIGEFKITAASEDAYIDIITLKIDNSADHSDFKLYDSSNNLLATGIDTGDKRVVFDLTSTYKITDGQSKIFTVTADVGGENAETLYVYLDKAVDLVATGGDYGFGMGVTFTGFDGTSSNRSASTIKGGELTFALVGPTVGDIRSNSQDQVLLEYNLTAVQDVTVKDMDIIVAGDDDADGDLFLGVEDGDASNDDEGLINDQAAGDEANIKDIKVVNKATGTVLMGPLELDSIVDSGVNETSVTGTAEDALQIIDFSDDFSLEAGETITLQITADIDDAVGANAVFGAALDISGLVVEDTNGDNLTNATDVVPTADINGYNQTVRAAGLTVSLASTPGDVSTYQGADDVVVQKFNVIGGLAGTVSVSNITLSVYADTTNTTGFTLGDHASAPDVNDYISTCSIYDNTDTLLGGPESPEADGTNIVFDNVDWDIAASESENLTVKCNIGNPSATTVYYFALDIADLSEDIVAQDEDGVDVDPTTDAPNGGVNPTNSLTVNNAGTVAITKDSSSPSADFLLTSSTNNLVAVYRATATTESFDINTLTFSEEAAEDDALGTDATTYANNISKVTITYPKEDGTTGTSSTTMSGNEAKFTGLDMFVDIDDPALVKVYVDLPVTSRHAGGSATSNEKVLMGLFVDTGNDDNFKAVGVGSGFTYDDDDQSALGTAATFIVRETKPTLSLSASSPSGTGFVPGDQEVFRFNIAANSNEDVVWSEMLFTISSTDNASVPTTWNYCDQGGAGVGEIAETDLDLYNLSTTGTGTVIEGVDTTDWTLLTSDGTECTDSTDKTTAIHLELTTAQTVPAGSTYTYALYFDSTGASSSADDSVQFGIAGDPNLSAWTISARTANVMTATDTYVTASGALDFGVGDLVCFDEDDGGASDCDSDEEVSLVTAVATPIAYLARGYAGHSIEAITAAHPINWQPSSFLWQDDGDSTVTAASSMDDYWGAYLVDGLPLTGGVMGF